MRKILVTLAVLCSGVAYAGPPIAVVRNDNCPPTARVQGGIPPVAMVFLPEPAPSPSPASSCPVGGCPVNGCPVGGNCPCPNGNCPVATVSYSTPVSTQVITGWNQVHSHQCGQCGTTWSHTNASYGSATAHSCPRCGSGPYYSQVSGSSRTVPVYRTVQQPTYYVQQPAATVYPQSMPVVRYTMGGGCPNGNCPIR